MRYLFLLLIFVLPIGLFATTIYMQSKDNNITYSDTPINNAKKIEVPTDANVLPEKNTATVVTTVSPLPVAVTSYNTFAITSPQDQQTFQNQRDIPVEIKIDPALEKGHKVAIYLDGQLYGNEQEKTTFNLLQLDRGIHEIYAVVFDANHTVIAKTKSLTIYIHFASAVNPPPRQAT